LIAAIMSLQLWTI